MWGQHNPYTQNLTLTNKKKKEKKIISLKILEANKLWTTYSQLKNIYNYQLYIFVCVSKVIYHTVVNVPKSQLSTYQSFLFNFLMVLSCKFDNTFNRKFVGSLIFSINSFMKQLNWNVWTSMYIFIYSMISWLSPFSFNFYLSDPCLKARPFTRTFQIHTKEICSSYNHIFMTSALHSPTFLPLFHRTFNILMVIIFLKQ